MRCRGADIYADTGEPKGLLFLHVSVGIGKRTSRCAGHENPLGLVNSFRVQSLESGVKPNSKLETLDARQILSRSACRDRAPCAIARRPLPVFLRTLFGGTDLLRCRGSEFRRRS